MPAVNRVMRVLEGFGVPCRRIAHGDAFTAGQVARESHVAPEAMAKVVVVRDALGRYVMAVLPASARLDMVALDLAVGSSPCRLVSEADLARLFPDCEAGAMPPFGGAYDMMMLVDACLAGQREIYFQPGNHHETVALSFAEYERLAAPVIVPLCRQHRRDAA